MKLIKTIAFALLLSSAAISPVVFTAGCTTNQQKIAYNSLYTLETSTTAAYDGYLSLVIKGAVTTNNVPVVSRSYNHFQASFLVALDAAQFNTNALAPSSLIVESQDVINLINNFKGGK